ncbi:MAG: hypothetical protein HQM03_13455 [Magnetococcales bacterium]|nr:hypothetical protein [Magnetococcales bacterium]
MDGIWIPVFLQVRERECLLVGDGAEARAKGTALLRAGARLTVVAPELAGSLLEEARTGRLRWLAERFRPDHLDGVWLAVSALADEEVNAAIHAAALARGVWLNVVDRPRYCTFVWPAVVERPPVTVAISTGGRSPALAGYLRRRIGEWLPMGIGGLAERLAEWRKGVPGGLAARARFWHNLLNDGLAERYLAGDEAGAEAMVREALAQKGEEWEEKR